MYEVFGEVKMNEQLEYRHMRISRVESRTHS
jgi:hypothetical protein